METITQDTLRYLAQVEDVNRPTREDYEAWFRMCEQPKIELDKEFRKCRKT